MRSCLVLVLTIGLIWLGGFSASAQDRPPGNGAEGRSGSSEVSGPPAASGSLSPFPAEAAPAEAAPAETPEEAKRLTAVSALNYLAVSLSNVLSTHDRLNLTQTAEAIQGNLEMSENLYDLEIVNLFSAVLHYYNIYKLGPDQKQVYEELYDRRIVEALEEARKNIRPEDRGALACFGSALTASLTPYLDWYTGEPDYQPLLQKNIWTVIDQDTEGFDRISRELLARTWRLLESRLKPGEKKLTAETAEKFNQIFQSPDQAVILSELKALEEKLDMYPPYWFYRGYYHLLEEQEREAQACFLRFEKIWRPIMAQDEMYSDAAKFRLMEAVRSGDTAGQRKYADLIVRHTNRENWLNLALAGVVYDELGDQAKAKDAFQLNLDRGRGILASSLALDRLSQNEKAASGITQFVDLQLTSDDFKETDLIFDYARKGSYLARYCLGYMYQYGEGVVQDRLEAFKWYRLAAEQGYASAQYALAVKYHLGDGTVQDSAEAAEWYEAAASQGVAGAMSNLGLMYLAGDGVARDQAKGLEFLKQASALGDPAAQFALGGLYFRGAGVPADQAEGIKWCRLAASKGYADAQFEIGRLYLQGLGVEQDYLEAAKWFRLASEQGLSRAQNSLGEMYWLGQGVAKDEAEALSFFRAAAEQGFAKAETYLGIMYRSGRGVEEDKLAAVRWFTKAALQGNTQAQLALGEMYEKGEGVVRNEAESLKWQRLAAGLEGAETGTAAETGAASDSGAASETGTSSGSGTAAETGTAAENGTESDRGVNKNN